MHQPHIISAEELQEYIFEKDYASAQMRDNKRKSLKIRVTSQGCCYCVCLDGYQAVYKFDSIPEAVEFYNSLD